MVLNNEVKVPFSVISFSQLLTSNIFLGPIWGCSCYVMFPAFGRINYFVFIAGVPDRVSVVLLNQTCQVSQETYKGLRI